MKKAFSILTVIVTIIILIITLSVFFLKNQGSGPLLISNVSNQKDTLITDEPMPWDPNRININSADVDQLTTLPGIGPVLAQRIIDYRTENGPYRSPAELLNIEGIGRNTLENIFDLITTGGST